MRPDILTAALGVVYALPYHWHLQYAGNTHLTQTAQIHPLPLALF